MQLFDVNVLVYAHRKDGPEFSRYQAWFREILDGGEPFGMADVVLSGFVRIVTNPKIFNQPTPLEVALAFGEEVRSRPTCVPVSAGPRHWRIFTELCRAVAAHGNLVTDAHLAALAIESDCEWITTDGDFARFPGLRWQHPLRG